MNLLLLLSALLSALTGVGATARQPQAAAAVMQQAGSRVSAVVKAPLAQRPANAMPRLDALAFATVIHAVSLIAGEPLYFARRRE